MKQTQVLELKKVNDLFLEIVKDDAVVYFQGYFKFPESEEVFLYQRVPECDRVAGGLFKADAHIGVARDRAVKLKVGDIIERCN